MSIKRISDLNWISLNKDEYPDLAIFDNTTSKGNINKVLSSGGGLGSDRSYNTESYSHTLFECSLPGNGKTKPDAYDNNVSFYESRKLTYGYLLLSALLPDIKTVFNATNGLVDVKGNDIKINNMLSGEYNFDYFQCKTLQVHEHAELSTTSISGGCSIDGGLNVDFINAEQYTTSPSVYCHTIAPWNDGSGNPPGPPGFPYGTIRVNANVVIGAGEEKYGLSADYINCTGDVSAKNFYGIAHTALWSDLAEFYESDEPYESGTLIKFGGEKEITIACDGEVNGIVSTKPGVVLNAEAKGLPIALAGRVPTKIVGPISKHDKVVLSDIPGVGRKAIFPVDKGLTVIGRALESKSGSDIGLVECVTKFSLV